MLKWVAMALALGVAVVAFLVLSPSAPPAQMRLEATLAGSGVDVTEQVTWFVERDGSWLGPGLDTTSEAVPGSYEARFDVLGALPTVANLSLGEGEGGTLSATLNATLIEVDLPEEARSGPVSFRYASDQMLGSQGVQVDAGVVRALVAPSLTELQLEIGGTALPTTADFASGAVERFRLEGGAVVPVP